MRLRTPIAAGRFYPGESSDCAQLLDELSFNLLPVPAIGAIAPHAGWIYSGRTAARSIVSLAARNPQTVVIFGAVHVPMRAEASVFGAGGWQTPLGIAEIDAECGREIGRIRQVHEDPESHRFEHSIEVLVPFIQQHLPQARILPLMVRPGTWAEDVGRECVRAIAKLGRRVAYLASTDLTHYGPAFGIEPAGHGEAGTRWAKEVNDRRLINLIAAGQTAEVVADAALNRSACGAGALAALLGAMAEIGPVRFHELEHTSSAAVERAAGSRTPENSVGYLAAAFLE